MEYNKVYSPPSLLNSADSPINIIPLLSFPLLPSPFSPPDVVILMVVNSGQISNLLFPDYIATLPPSTTVLLMSTISPEACLEVRGRGWSVGVRAQVWSALQEAGAKRHNICG